MTRKHYVMIAESIKGAYSNIDPTYGGDAFLAQRETLYDAAQRIARRLEEDNARFDRVRFLNACGFNGEANK